MVCRGTQTGQRSCGTVIPRDIANTSPRKHGDVDTRIIVRVGDAEKYSYKIVMIRSVDTNVVVLGVVAFILQMGSLKSLWEAFGTGRKFRFIPNHEMARSLEPRKCQESKTIRFVLAFAGCDSLRQESCKGHLECLFESY